MNDPSQDPDALKRRSTWRARWQLQLQLRLILGLAVGGALVVLGIILLATGRQHAGLVGILIGLGIMASMGVLGLIFRRQIGLGYPGRPGAQADRG